MKKVITAFKEHKEFKEKRPWDATIMTFPSDEIVPPHYAETIEVLLCCEICGDIHIGGKHFVMGGKQAFFIPPNTVHSVNYKKNDGRVVVLKINPEQFKPAIDLEAVLAYTGHSFNDMPLYLEEYDKINIIAKIFANSLYPTEVIGSIMDLIGILLEYTNTEKNVLQESAYNDELRKIIIWTEKHFFEKISLEDVAAFTGYDKHYFCNKFKMMTGITYLNYLNTLRIHHACTLLKSGLSVKQTCDECSFENVSYFIKLFKKITGSTPKQYVSKI